MGNIISTILLVASAGMFFAYINPNYAGVTNASEFKDKSIKELRNDESQYLAALTKTKEISEIQSGLVSKFNSIPREQRDLLGKLLPDHVDTVRLIIDINRIVELHNMSLDNISITSIGEKKVDIQQSIANGPTGGPSESSSSGFDSVTIGFSVSGPYESFLKFIKDLETSLRIIDIVSLSMEGGSDGVTKYTFSIKTFFLK